MHHPPPLDVEQPKKKPRMGKDSEGAPGAIAWSWPKRVDEIVGMGLGDCLAITDDTQQITWAELAQRSKVVAKSLKNLGFTGVPRSAYRKNGEAAEAAPPMVTMLPHALESVILILGVLRQGFPLLPLSITHRNRTQLLQRYEDAMMLFEPVAAVVTDSEQGKEAIAELKKKRPMLKEIFSSRLLHGDAFVEDYQDVITTTDNVLSYMFTSGSTGKSKCTVATNRMAWAESQWYPELFEKLGYQVDPRKDRWRLDHEMGWWGAAFFGEVDVALAMAMCIVMMKPTDSNWGERGVTVSGALPSQLNNLWPGAKNIPSTLKVVFSWAERCDVELGRAWKAAGVKMADLLIATEYFLTFASCNLELAKSQDGREAHLMRPLGAAKVFILDQESLTPMPDANQEVTGMLGVAGPQVTPGYVERLDDGRAVIGAGPLSQDIFKVINDEWVLVPKDIVKKRPDQSIVSIGRGGGLVKTLGGVLVATGVAELQLTSGAVSACCITDPLHSEGGQTVVLELQPGFADLWGLRKSLRDAAFLRLPILYTCSMPRNESTGKVQKALVQEVRHAEVALDVEQLSEHRRIEATQVAWYWRMSKPVLFFILLAQPRSSWNLIQAVLSDSIISKFLWTTLTVLGIGKESVLQLSLVAWTYGAFAQAGSCGSKFLGLVPAVVFSIGVVAGSWTSAFISTALMSLVILGAQEKWKKLTDKVGRLCFSIVVALLLRLPLKDASWLYALGLLLLYASNRRLPASSLVQAVASYGLSLLESARYLGCFPVLFVLGLPSIIRSEWQNFAWKRCGAPETPEGFKKQVPPEIEMEGVSGEKYWQRIPQRGNKDKWTERIWVDVKDKAGILDVDPMAAHPGPKPRGETPTQERVQKLAKEAGVDFVTVDSLKIQRLLMRLQKYMKTKKGGDPLEYTELSEATLDERSFLDWAEQRLEVADAQEDGKYVNHGAKKSGMWWNPIVEWITGGLRIHREAATNAPWDCQVDVLLKWEGPPLDEARLNEAVEIVIQQQPMLRACVPPDDSTDLLIGGGNSGFSTTVAATWSLLNEQNLFEGWPEILRWMVPEGSMVKVREAVATALYYAWPRTLVRPTNRMVIPKLQQTCEAPRHLADEVFRVMNGSGWDWWKKDSPLNMCLINLDINGEVPTFCLYCSVTHKYGDGGAAAALVTAVADAYAALERGEPVSRQEHPVVSVQEQRLWRYLEGKPGEKKNVDVYLFDIVGDIYNHKWGHSVGTDLTDSVCDLVRAAGRKMACSEEIAWLGCMSCAMLRLLPEEQLLKLLIVHNGRLGQAEGAVACVSNYVMVKIPCIDKTTTPIADICSRVKYAISQGDFCRPRSTEQAHARINIGGMIGTDGHFVQLFKSAGTGREAGWSRAPYMIQLRMDNEGGIWCVKDFKCHEFLDPTTFWRATVAVAQDIATGKYTNPLIPRFR